MESAVTIDEELFRKYCHGKYVSSNSKNTDILTADFQYFLFYIISIKLKCKLYFVMKIEDSSSEHRKKTRKIK